MRSSMRFRSALLLAVMGLVAAACFGGGDESLRDEEASAVTSAPAFADVEAELDAAGEPGDEAAREVAPGAPAVLGSGEVVTLSQRTTEVGRNIIFTADLTVAVTDVAAAGIEAAAVVESLGGLLFGQQTVGGSEPISVLTFKVFPEDFQEVLSRLASLGELRSQNVSAQDVTERVVDLESRIATAEVSVERLRGLLDSAGNIVDIAAVEGQLLERETLLETLRAQLRTLQDRVGLATIVLTLREALTRPAMDVTASAYPGEHDAGVSCPGDGSLSVVEGDPVTVCLEITNRGDTPLTGFEVRDPVLDIELSDLVVVFGDPSGVIEPGQSIVLAAELVLERNLRTQTRVTAVPVDAEGRPVEERPVSSTATLFIDAVDPGGLPGFGDGIAASWDVLTGVGGLFILVGGAVIPFLWLLALAGLFLWWRSRRRGDEAAVAGTSDPGRQASVD